VHRDEHAGWISLLDLAMAMPGERRLMLCHTSECVTDDTSNTSSAFDCLVATGRGGGSDHPDCMLTSFLPGRSSPLATHSPLGPPALQFSAAEANGLKRRIAAKHSRFPMSR